jgi:hypothetical protein
MADVNGDVVGVAAVGVGLLLVIGAVRGTWRKLWDDVIGSSGGGGNGSGSGSSGPQGIGPTGIPNLPVYCVQHPDKCVGPLLPHVPGLPFYAPNGTAQNTPGELVPTQTGTPVLY